MVTGKPGRRRELGCGTRAAYYWHLSHDEKPCAPCSDANNAYQTAWRRSRGVRPISEANPRPKCGTVQGYGAHMRRGEEACGPCKEGHARYHRKQDLKAGRVKEPYGPDRRKYV